MRMAGLCFRSAFLPLALLSWSTFLGCKSEENTNPNPSDADAGVEIPMDPLPNSMPLGRDLPRPTVSISEPAADALLHDGTIVVRGTVRAEATQVMVRGVVAVIEAGQFRAENVVLREGENLVVAEATNASGGTATDAVNVV